MDWSNLVERISSHESKTDDIEAFVTMRAEQLANKSCQTIDVKKDVIYALDIPLTPLILTTEVTEDIIYFKSYPYSSISKPYMVSRDVGEKLIVRGMEKWMKRNSTRSYSGLYAHFRHILAGGIAKTTKASDIEFVIVTVKYVPTYFSESITGSWSDRSLEYLREAISEYGEADRGRQDDKGNWYFEVYMSRLELTKLRMDQMFEVVSIEAS